ncbi:MAG: 4Fe-4S dicluster domain-containing protein [Candidatus Thorarchaeota archaeon]|nr:4Fe-4S dicluster domain-containing protein [Candidatus Thorarchaeota archaeon]
MVRRLMIMIDEERCTGCGLCVPNCAEGALEIIDGKAKVVSESFCDGLGACLGHCPEGALSLREVDTIAFDEEAAMAHVAASSSEDALKPCAGSQAFEFASSQTETHEGAIPEQTAQSRLDHWPVKMRLVTPNHPAFENARLLLIADCVGPAYAGLHEDFMKGRTPILMCPKFEDYQSNFDKLIEIISNHNLQDIAVLRMEVPCCGGIDRLTRLAMEQSGKQLPVRTYTIGVKGEIKAVH